MSKLEAGQPEAAPSALNIPNTPEIQAPRTRTAEEWKEISDDAQAARTARQDAANIISDFLIAAQSKNILSANVSSIYSDGTNVYWECYRGPITIRIPFEETMESLPQPLLDPLTENLAARRQQFLRKSIGFEIPFIVTSFMADPNSANKEHIAIGSRVAALRRIRHRYFGSDAYNPDAVGDIVTATVISVGPGALQLYFHGVEVRASNQEMTHRYTSNLETRYAPGDTVKVKIMSIDDSSSRNPTVTVSGRAVELEEAKARHNRIKEGSIFAATVSSIRTQPSLRISLWLEGIDVPGYAAAKEMKNPGTFYSGDKVYVEVLGITKNGYVHTKILRKAGRR